MSIYFNFIFYLNKFLDCTRINDPQGTFQYLHDILTLTLRYYVMVIHVQENISYQLVSWAPA